MFELKIKDACDSLTIGLCNQTVKSMTMSAIRFVVENMICKPLLFVACKFKDLIEKMQFKPGLHVISFASKIKKLFANINIERKVWILIAFDIAIFMLLIKIREKIIDLVIKPTAYIFKGEYGPNISDESINRIFDSKDSLKSIVSRIIFIIFIRFAQKSKSYADSLLIKKPKRAIHYRARRIGKRQIICKPKRRCNVIYSMSHVAGQRRIYKSKIINNAILQQGQIIYKPISKPVLAIDEICSNLMIKKLIKDHGVL